MNELLPISGMRDDTSAAGSVFGANGNTDTPGFTGEGHFAFLKCMLGKVRHIINKTNNMNNGMVAANIAM